MIAPFSVPEKSKHVKKFTGYAHCLSSVAQGKLNKKSVLLNTETTQPNHFIRFLSVFFLDFCLRYGISLNLNSHFLALEIVFYTLLELIFCFGQTVCSFVDFQSLGKNVLR